VTDEPTDRKTDRRTELLYMNIVVCGRAMRSTVYVLRVECVECVREVMSVGCR